jgi:hypothetical protein
VLDRSASAGRAPLLAGRTRSTAGIADMSHEGAVHYAGFACARSSTDRASDYGSEGWGFESLRARRRSEAPSAGPKRGRPICLQQRLQQQSTRMPQSSPPGRLIVAPIESSHDVLDRPLQRVLEAQDGCIVRARRVACRGRPTEPWWLHPPPASTGKGEAGRCRRDAPSGFAYVARTAAACAASGRLRPRHPASVRGSDPGRIAAHELPVPARA